MKLVVNEPIRYCPHCTYEFKWDSYNRNDFYAGVCFTCPECQSVVFQYINVYSMERNLFNDLDELFFDGTYSGKEKRRKKFTEDFEDEVYGKI